MGLDHYIYRVRKPQLEERVYESAEIDNMPNMHRAFLKDAEEEMELIEQLLPYTVVRDVESQFINAKKLFEDYNIPENAHMCYMSSFEITYAGTDENGKRVEKTVSTREIDEKYTIKKVLPCYIWESEEVQYWRKHYELQDWIYEHIDGVQNTGYYILDADLIRELNKEFDEHIPKEDPDDESALFYWEWY